MKAGDFRKEVLDIIRDNFDYDKRIPMEDYETALDKVLDAVDEEDMTLEEIEKELTDVEGNVHDYADGSVHPYTADLLRWYLEDINRVYYMEDAIKELGAEDGFQVLTGGQYLYWEEVLNEVIEVCLQLIETKKKK
jgi:phosphoglucomutase